MGLVWTALLNAGLGLGAYGVARFGLRQPSGLPRALAAAVLAWAWVVWGLELLGVSGEIGRGPLLAWVGAGLVLGLLCWRFGRDDSPEGLGREAPWGWVEVGSLGLLLWGAAAFAGPSLLLPVKVISDGPIYHLYFAARWWKSGRLEWIATPFGENAAPYFPANGDLWFTWLFVGGGGDRLAKVGQAPFLAAAGLTMLAAARRLGAGRPGAALAAAWFVTSTPLLFYSFEPIVDTIFVAGYLAGAYFFLRHALGDDGPGALVLGALAAGVALGTKAPALVFVPPLLGIGAVSALVRGRGWRGKLTGALTVPVVAASGAGFWFVRNAVATGNPLYPLHLEAFGRVWLSGWYGPGVMRYSPYYLPVTDLRALADLVLSVIDPRLTPVWLAALGGAWVIGRGVRRAEDRAVGLASALAVANVGLFWLLIPYRTQQRFMLHAVGLAAVPLARLFDRSAWLRAAGLALLAAHVLTPQSWPFGPGEPPWDFSPIVPNSVAGPVNWPVSTPAGRAAGGGPFSALPLALTVGMGLASFATAWAWGRAFVGGWPERGALAAGATALLCGMVAAASYPRGDDDRRQFFPPFPDYYRGWLALDLRSGPAGSRVAYAGTNLPYYLMGVGLRNEVRYVNVDAHPGWLLHDYHLGAARTGTGPKTWGLPRPGWDRVRPDYPGWLSNLRAEQIRLLVVARVNPAEGPHNVADPEGFPVERVWADAHPEVFDLLHGDREGDRLFRLYRVKPPDDGGGPPLPRRPSAGGS